MKKSQHFLTLSQQPDRPRQLLRIGVIIDICCYAVIGMSHDLLQVFGAGASLYHHTGKSVACGVQRPFRKLQPFQQRVILPLSKIVIALFPALCVAYKILARLLHQCTHMSQHRQRNRNCSISSRFRFLTAYHVRRLAVKMHVRLANRKQFVDSQS